MGIKCRICVLTDAKSVKFWREIDNDAEVITSQYTFQNIFYRTKLIRRAKAMSCQVMYVRDAFPMWLRAKQSKIVVEFQSLISEELRERSFLKYITFLLFSQFTYWNIDGAVYITNELKSRNEMKLSNNIPSIQISNGIDLSVRRALPVSKLDRPAVFFMGHPNQYWQGVEEIESLAVQLPTIDFHIVGYDGESSARNIFFHGVLSEERYFAIARDCVAAVGPMRIDLKGISEAAPLKVREYLALGLPVIINYHDVDLLGDLDFVLEIDVVSHSKSEMNDKVLGFVDYWRGKRVQREQVQFLSTEYSETKRLNFLRELMRD
jgi:glycosyltransferase involved in cell wall biosynthesis